LNIIKNKLEYKENIPVNFTDTLQSLAARWVEVDVQAGSKAPVQHGPSNSVTSA
jgi:hypothetical protein